MPRGICNRHGPNRPCSCGMGNLYRFVEPVTLYLLKIKAGAHGYTLAADLNEYGLTDSLVEPGALYRTLRRLEKRGMSFRAGIWKEAGLPAGTISSPLQERITCASGWKSWKGFLSHWLDSPRT